MSSQHLHFDIQQLQAICGHASAAEARVYVRLPAAEIDATRGPRLRLLGSVHGPVSAAARTLPYRVPLVDRGQGDGLLAEAILPDPGFWTPAAPLLYEIAVEVVDVVAADVMARGQLLVGLRTFGVRGDSLWWEGKRFVLRAVSRDAAPAADIRDWRESAAMAVSDTDAGDDLCERASRQGIPLVVDFSAVDVADLPAQLRRTARWPAAIVAILPASSGPIAALREAAPNIVFAAPWEPRLASDCDAVVCDPNAGDDIARVMAVGKPILLRQTGRSWPTLAAARAECDAMQCQFASLGQFAGYLV